MFFFVFLKPRLCLHHLPFDVHQLKRAVTRVIGSNVRTNRKCMFVLHVMAKLLVHVNLIGGSELYLNNMTVQEHRSDENKAKQPQRLTFANFRSVARLRLC